MRLMGRARSRNFTQRIGRIRKDRKEEYKIKNLLCVLCVVLCALCVIFSSCLKDEKSKIETEEVILPEKPDPLREKAQEIAASMDDSLLVSQLFITGIDGRGRLPQHMQILLKETPAGGIMLFGYNLNTNKDSIRNLITETKSLIKDQSGIEPFIAIDLEGGIVNRINDKINFPAITALPEPSSYWMKYPDLIWDGVGDIPHEFSELLTEIENDSYKAGCEASDIGINLNFAPVAEALNYDNMTFLLYRSYGHDIFFTAEACAAFVNGMRRAGVLCVPKHFPASAGRDPHYTASVINADLDTLKNYILPFKKLFSNDARAVMIAHTLIPVIDDKVASLSAAVMNDWLKVELGFEGIIIADDFTMAAAKVEGKTHEQAAVLSVAAGADMILVWQNNLKRTHAAFMTALEDGTLTRERLQEAVARIIYEKLKMN